jgi:hypothetical protein
MIRGQRAACILFGYLPPSVTLRLMARAACLPRVGFAKNQIRFALI